MLDEEQLNTLTILINKIDLIHRIRSHQKASSKSEHLYNLDLSSMLALLSKLSNLNKRISPLKNGVRKEKLCTFFLSILFIEVPFLSLSGFQVHEQAQALRKTQLACRNFLNHGDSGPGCCCASPGKDSVPAASLCPLTLQGRVNSTLSVSLHLENKIFKPEAKLFVNLKETRTIICKVEQTHLYYLNNSFSLRTTLLSLSKWCKK